MNNYFSHDSNARSDERMLALRMKLGWAGYGLYWALIEKLRESNRYRLTPDYDLLAYDLRADASLLKSVVEDFGLFAFGGDGGEFYSESLLRRMEIKDGKSEKARRAVSKRWGKVTAPGAGSVERADVPGGTDTDGAVAFMEAADRAEGVEGAEVVCGVHGARGADGGEGEEVVYRADSTYAEVFGWDTDGAGLYGVDTNAEGASCEWNADVEAMLHGRNTTKGKKRKAEYNPPLAPLGKGEKAGEVREAGLLWEAGEVREAELVREAGGVKSAGTIGEAGRAKEAGGTSGRRGRFRPPEPEEVAAYCAARQNGIEAREFCDFYAAKGWMIGRSAMRDWRAAVRTWENKRKAALGPTSGMDTKIAL